MVLRTKTPQTLLKPRVFIVFISCEWFMRPPQPACSPGFRATGHESPGRAQLACSIVRVVGCLHADVSSPWPTHGWSDVWRSLTSARPSGRWADGGRRNRDSLCQLPAASCRRSRWRSSSDWPLRRRSTASPPIRPAQLLQLLLSVFCSRTHLTRHTRIVRRAKQDTCSCKQCENLVAPLSGGAALEEAAAWEAQQMEAARHAKELQSQYWGRQRQQRARRDWRRLSG